MTPGERLRNKRTEKGLSAEDLAARVGRSVSAVRNQENGTNGIPATLARKYAQALGTTAAWILYGDDTPEADVPPELTSLPMIGPVQAGAWLAIDDTGQDEPPMLPAARDRRYPQAAQWLREVRGDSMNARNIYPGDLAHIVELIGSGVNLNTGMIVEVTRERDGGGLREITLKEVEIGDDGSVVLWPRSTNQKWKDPVRLGDDTGSDIQVTITGLLLAKITRF
jgi:transcriptional regulator with XRE-family HTH domain